MESSDSWKEFVLNDGSKSPIPKYLNIEKDKDLNILIKDNNNLILGKKPKTSLYVDQIYWPWKEFPNIPDNYPDQDLNRHLWAIPMAPWHLDIFRKEHYKIFIRDIRELYEKTDYAITLLV